MKLYEITSDFKALDDLYLDAIDEETGEIKDGAILDEFEKELTNELKAKSKNIVGFLRDTDLMLDAVDTEIKRLQALKKSGETKLNNFKKYIINNMQNLNIQKIETPLGTMSLRKSSAVNVSDELDQTDKRYMKEKISYTVSKTEIKKLIESGETIKGASIVQNVSLQVK